MATAYKAASVRLQRVKLTKIKLIIQCIDIEVKLYNSLRTENQLLCVGIWQEY